MARTVHPAVSPEDADAVLDALRLLSLRATARPVPTLASASGTVHTEVFTIKYQNRHVTDGGACLRLSCFEIVGLECRRPDRGLTTALLRALRSRLPHRLLRVSRVRSDALAHICLNRLGMSAVEPAWPGEGRCFQRGLP